MIIERFKVFARRSNQLFSARAATPAAADSGMTLKCPSFFHYRAGIINVPIIGAFFVFDSFNHAKCFVESYSSICAPMEVWNVFVGKPHGAPSNDPSGGWSDLNTIEALKKRWSNVGKSNRFEYCDTPGAECFKQVVLGQRIWRRAD